MAMRSERLALKSLRNPKLVSNSNLTAKIALTQKRQHVKLENDECHVKTEEIVNALDSSPYFIKPEPISPSKKKLKGIQNVEKEIKPPANWELVYRAIQNMRKNNPAPVDTVGCERLADTDASPKDRRLQTLIALMLSAQTKDTVTGEAISRLKKELPYGLTLKSLLEIDESALNSIICKVGMHNRKAAYIKKTSNILDEQYGGDIPDTVEGLMALPGVGPKMAYLCMTSAWSKVLGIGVDVHVHRITNLLGWNKTKTPEETRKALEAWLPREKWREINPMLVGFGQTICLPVGRKCDKCDLARTGLCRSDLSKKLKVKVEDSF